MFRSSARPSAEAIDAAIVQLSHWAEQARGLALFVCVALGVGTGLFALDRLQGWEHVFALAYGTVGLGMGFAAYAAIARPLLRASLRRRAARIATDRGIPLSEIERPVLAFLV